ncbi:MAG TPA: hypothetical protein VI072_18380 [Polyangiaceae bacterium]
MPPNPPLPHRIRAKRNVAVFFQRHDALTTGVKQHIEDVKTVSKSVLAGNHSPSEFVADVTALWINGASLVASAVFGLPFLSEGADDDRQPGGPGQPGPPGPGQQPAPPKPRT